MSLSNVIYTNMPSLCVTMHRTALWNYQMMHIFIALWYCCT